MRTSTTSTLAASEANRRTILEMQSQLVRAQTEATTGRVADVGLQLGTRTAESINLRNDHARLGGIVDTNALVGARLDATQGALGGVLETAQAFLDSLAVAHSGTVDPTVVRQQGTAALEGLMSALNTTVNGEHLFAGINTDAMPVAGYFSDPAPASRLAVASAFVGAFGVPQDSPAAAGISATDMQTFLNAGFGGLFDAAGWTADWSSASDQTIRSRISLHETVASGTTANHPALRKLAEAFTMVADLGLENLNDAAAKVVIDRALTAAGEGIGQLASLQASLGTAQQQVTRASERMSLQLDILNTQVNAIESVDPYEAATRVNTLLTQIEMSYTLTGRIQQMTLLNYL